MCAIVTNQNITIGIRNIIPRKNRPKANALIKCQLRVPTLKLALKVHLTGDCRFPSYSCRLGILNVLNYSK